MSCGRVKIRTYLFARRQLGGRIGCGIRMVASVNGRGHGHVMGENNKQRIEWYEAVGCVVNPCSPSKVKRCRKWLRPMIDTPTSKHNYCAQRLKIVKALGLLRCDEGLTRTTLS